MFFFTSNRWFWLRRVLSGPLSQLTDVPALNTRNSVTVEMIKKECDNKSGLRVIGFLNTPNVPLTTPTADMAQMTMV
jgi:hypothetical protein